VLDVQTLARYRVDPWVPIVPGVPIKSLSREGDRVRAFSPARTQYVLAASGIDYDKPGQPPAHGLLVVDIASGTATELRVDRRQFRFAGPDDIDVAWIDHHFAWHRDGAGHERLQPRPSFRPWPWRARVQAISPPLPQLEIPRIDAAFLPVLERLVRSDSTGEAKAGSSAGAPSLALRLGGCAWSARAYGVGSPMADDHRIVVSHGADSPPADIPACRDTLLKLAASIDAELATQRHDALLRLD
jgi:hypothetical protein